MGQSNSRCMLFAIQIGMLHPLPRRARAPFETRRGTMLLISSERPTLNGVLCWLHDCTDCTEIGHDPTDHPWGRDQSDPCLVQTQHLMIDPISSLEWRDSLVRILTEPGYRRLCTRTQDGNYTETDQYLENL